MNINIINLKHIQQFLLQSTQKYVELQDFYVTTWKEVEVVTIMQIMHDYFYLMWDGMADGTGGIWIYVVFLVSFNISQI